MQIMIVVGLGNPGDTYAETRHNAGRMVLEMSAPRSTDFRYDKKANAQIGNVSFGDTRMTFILPDTYMNNSGQSVAPYVKSPKDLAKLVVVYDELDLPLGSIKISFDRSSGGHNGVESIIKTVKSREFIRVRIGISPATPTGKLKKMTTDKMAEDFLMKRFTPKQKEVLEQVAKRVQDALVMIATEGKEKAMTEFNQ